MVLKHLFLGTASAVALLTSPAAFAQVTDQQAAPAADPQATAPERQPAQGSDYSGEIVVTAQRRSESVQTIPLAVSAIGGDSLASRGTTGLAGLGQTSTTRARRRCAPSCCSSRIRS